MVDGCSRWPHLFFLFGDSRIVSYLHFACNWQNRFWDSEPVVARFLSNKGGNLDMWIPCNSTELQPAPFMRVVCQVHGLGSSRTLKQNVLSLILLIPLMELMNQKRGICRHCILYPLQLGPPFPNDAKILRTKFDLGPNQIINWLEEGFYGKYSFFMNKIKLFLDNKGHGNPRAIYACTHM